MDGTPRALTDTAAQRSLPDAKVLALTGIAFLWAIFAGVLAVPAPLVSDDWFYLAMMDALVNHGTLFLDNGYGEFPSDTLRIRYLIPTPDGLAPQYPSGYAFLAAPAYMLLGAHGPVMLNTLAAIATLPVIVVLGRHLFDDRELALNAALIWALGSFAFDLTVGIWPHGLATFFAAAAFAAAAVAWKSRPNADLGFMALAGLAAGAGIHARVDCVLVAPAIAIWILGVHRRPYLALAAFAVGLAPGLAAAAALNAVKFGVFSPVSYGRTGDAGATSPAAYAPLAAVALGVAAGALLLGLERVRRFAARPAVIAGGIVVVALLVAAIAPLREIAARLIVGFYGLVIDFGQYAGSPRGVEIFEDGSLRVHGFIKKALLQSVPYAAAILMLLPAAFTGRNRPAILGCLLSIAIFVAPFAWLSWHGNSGNSMRYFAYTLPFVAVLSAAALREIGPGRRFSIGIAAVLFVLAVLAVRMAWHAYDVRYIVQVPLANLTIVALAALSLALLLLPRSPLRPVLASAARGVFLLGLAVAFVSGYVFDLATSQVLRATGQQGIELAADLPANSLYYTLTPAMAPPRLNAPPRMTARADTYDIRIDRELVAYAFASGRRVFAQTEKLAEAMVAQGAAGAMRRLSQLGPEFDVYELFPPGAEPAGAAPSGESGSGARGSEADAAGAGE